MKISVLYSLWQIPFLFLLDCRYARICFFIRATFFHSREIRTYVFNSKRRFHFQTGDNSISLRSIPTKSIVNVSCFDTPNGPLISNHCPFCKISFDKYFNLFTFEDRPEQVPEPLNFQLGAPKTP